MSDRIYSSKHEEYYDTVRYRPIKSLPEKLGRILDVGGGNGATSRYLIDKGRAKSSLIVDPYSTSEDLENVKFMKRDADAECFQDMQAAGEKFDTVLCLDVLEHLMDPWSVLESLRPLLEPGGTLFISIPNARFVALTVPLLLYGRFDYKVEGLMDRTHIRWFTKSTAVEMIEGAGYRVENVDAYINKRVAKINIATLGLFRRMFEYQYYITARV